MNIELINKSEITADAHDLIDEVEELNHEITLLKDRVREVSIVNDQLNKEVTLLHSKLHDGNSEKKDVYESIFIFI